MDLAEVTDPGVVDRLSVEESRPEPESVLPPGETPDATARLSPGWVAVTDRVVVSYHPESEPPLVETPRANVAGLAVRRAGGRRFLGYVPTAVLYGLLAGVLGAVLLSVSPGDLLAVPEAPGASAIERTIRTLGMAARLLGTVLVFAGVLLVLGAVATVAYWLFSRRVVLAVEREGAAPIELPATKSTGRRAIADLEPAVSEGGSAHGSKPPGDS